MASCEHFDVVLAFNVLHHFGKDWQKAAEAVLGLGDNILIESPSESDTISQKNLCVPLLAQYLVQKNGKMIFECSRHTDLNSKGKLFWFAQQRLS